MKVIAHSPQYWFLLEEDNCFYLHVNCSHSAFGFSRLIKLSEQEMIEHKKKGIQFINKLAENVQFHALSTYAERNLEGVIEEKCHEAIMLFNIKKATNS